MTQTEIPFTDQPESRQERMARILAGRIEGVTTAAKLFDDAEADRLKRYHQQLEEGQQWR